MSPGRFVRSLAKVLVVSVACSAQAADAPARNAKSASVENGAPQKIEAPAKLRVGAVFGALSPQPIRDTVVLRPWRTRLTRNFQTGVQAIYTAWRFDRVPLDIEVEGGVSKRFGTAYGGDAWEFYGAPVEMAAVERLCLHEYQARDGRHQLCHEGLEI